MSACFIDKGVSSPMNTTLDGGALLAFYFLLFTFYFSATGSKCSGSYQPIAIRQEPPGP
jgi:hypothetical protein